MTSLKPNCFISLAMASIRMTLLVQPAGAISVNATGLPWGVTQPAAVFLKPMLLSRAAAFARLWV